MDRAALGAQSELIGGVVEIVIAYLSKNGVESSELAPLISAIHSALRDAASLQVEETFSQKPTQAEIRRSIKPDGIMSFINGKTYRTLRRHLMKHNLDPQSYRSRYGLPRDYPMIAIGYSERRSELSRSHSLSRRSKKRLEEDGS